MFIGIGGPDDEVSLELLHRQVLGPSGPRRIRRTATIVCEVRWRISLASCTAAWCCLRMWIFGAMKTSRGSEVAGLSESKSELSGCQNPYQHIFKIIQHIFSRWILQSWYLTMFFGYTLSMFCSMFPSADFEQFTLCRDRFVATAGFIAPSPERRGQRAKPRTPQVRITRFSTDKKSFQAYCNEKRSSKSNRKHKIFWVINWTLFHLFSGLLSPQLTGVIIYPQLYGFDHRFEDGAGKTTGVVGDTHWRWRWGRSWARNVWRVMLGSEDIQKVFNYEINICIYLI